MGVGGAEVGPGITAPGAAAAPSNLIVGSSASSSKIQIPGLSGSPDIEVPAGAGNSQFNDEFDDNTSGAPAGWTAFNTPALCNTSDSLSELHLQSPGTTNDVGGIFKSIVAGSFPMTITMKVTETLFNATTQSPGAGMLVSPVALGGAGTAEGIVFSQSAASPAIPQAQWGTINTSTFAWAKTGQSIPGMPPNSSVYLRLVLDATGANVTPFMSIGGRIWFPLTGAVAISGAAILVAIFANGNGGNVDTDAYFDWIRFT